MIPQNTQSSLLYPILPLPYSTSTTPIPALITSTTPTKHIPTISVTTPHHHRHVWSTEIIRSLPHQYPKHPVQNDQQNQTCDITKQQLHQTLLTISPKQINSSTTSGRFKRPHPGPPTNTLTPHTNHTQYETNHRKYRRKNKSQISLTKARPYFK